MATLADLLGLGSLTQTQAPSTPTGVQTQAQQLPGFVQPYVEDILGRSYALTTQTPYMPYAGERVAGFTPMQQQAFQQLQGMQPSAQLGQATDLATQAGQYGLGAGQQYAQAVTSPATLQSYMSPYMQDVVDYQKQQAIKDYARALPGMQAQAANVGAFGGSRQAVIQAEAERNLRNQLAGIQATGTQNAYQQALQNMQYGAGLGMQGAQLGSQAAGQLGQLGQAQFGQQMGINTAQQQAGAQQQALQQQNLTNAYQDYLTQLQYPYQQLQFQKSMLSGLPGIQQGTTTTTGYQAPAPVLSQLAGLGGVGMGIYGLMKKEGGVIDSTEKPKKYADGGVVGGVGDLDNQVNNFVKMGTLRPDSLDRYLTDPKTKLAATLAKQILDGEREAVSNEQALKYEPQPPVLDQIALASLPVSGFNFDGHMAGGGIVAFAGDGEDGSLVKGDAAYKSAMEESFPVVGPQYLGAGIADIIRAPGQLGWDWDHYKRTGEMKRKYETQGVFPVTSSLAESRSVENPPEQPQSRQGQPSLMQRILFGAQPTPTVPAAPALTSSLPDTSGGVRNYPAAGPTTPVRSAPTPAPRAGLSLLATPAAATTPAGIANFSGTQPIARSVYADELGMLGMGIAEREAKLRAMQTPTEEESIAAVRKGRERAGIKGEVGEEREKELRSQAAKVGDEKKEAFYLSLVEAGLGILGESRPGVTGLRALAGATKGLDRFASLTKDIKTTQAKREEELANITNLRRAEALGVAKEGKEDMLRRERYVQDLTDHIDATKLKAADVLSKSNELTARLAADAAKTQQTLAAHAAEGALDRASRERIANVMATKGENAALEEARSMYLNEIRAAKNQTERDAIDRKWKGTIMGLTGKEDPITAMNRIATSGLPTGQAPVTDNFRNMLVNPSK